ncbi:transcriptional regulator [Microlunatus endophyticus]|uniref:Transcriptional regulator n=1 Tax=Microlunatus endophyticus TaxID=1716077 RepID=A0A917S8L8_9ACTN|nr:helix-turn-helix transcriptional regulator [Microlunatus endophyticus]GGL63842.1 transcriptional regulator [Microlunatus endophyticus]
MTEAPQPPQPQRSDAIPGADVVPLGRHRRPGDPLLRTLLGGVLRRARHDQKRTLSDVAETAGISVPYLSEIERGRKEPSSEMLAAVCGALDLDLLDLVWRTYVDLLDHEVQETLTVRPQRVGAGRIGHPAGRPGDVLALAA